MPSTHVEFLLPADRIQLSELLQAEEEFPAELIYLYLRASGPHENLVAWRGDKIVGMLTGAFDNDFRDERDFSDFSIPESPHGLIVRMVVDKTERRSRIGSDLIEAFVDLAAQRGCSFIGGYIDRSTDPSTRTLFFRDAGFRINPSACFGALTHDLLASRRPARHGGQTGI